jgi:hypothetical protein
MNWQKNQEEMFFVTCILRFSIFSPSDFSLLSPPLKGATDPRHGQQEEQQSPQDSVFITP